MRGDQVERLWTVETVITTEEPSIPGVYFVEGAGLIKIGTSSHIPSRLRDLRASSPVPLTLMATIPFAGKYVEAYIHQLHYEDRHHGEWFNPSRELAALIAGERDDIFDAVNPWKYAKALGCLDRGAVAELPNVRIGRNTGAWLPVSRLTPEQLESVLTAEEPALEEGLVEW